MPTKRSPLVMDNVIYYEDILGELCAKGDNDMADFTYEDYKKLVLLNEWIKNDKEVE